MNRLSRIVKISWRDEDIFFADVNSYEILISNDNLSSRKAYLEKQLSPEELKVYSNHRLVKERIPEILRRFNFN